MPFLHEDTYKFCSTQINLNGLAAQRALMAAAMIPDSALGVEGREDQPHLTVQYGIHADDPEPVRRALANVAPFQITLGRTAMFPPSKHSSGDAPVFVGVRAGSDKLLALRNAIRAVVPVRDSFPNYIPHVCIAYVRTDAAAQYVGKDWLDGTVVLVNEIVFSNTEGEHVSIPLGRITESTDDSVCVMDFGGSYNSKKHGRIYPFNCWADWYPQKKAVVFGGAYADVPDMPAAKEPTEAAVERWVKKHWKEDEWYPKYLKALSAAEESSPVVERINSLLDRLGEADDFSPYRNNSEKFRAKFGDTSVADHTRMAGEFKTRADKLRKDYEARTKVKAMGASKYANLRYYFDRSTEGQQYNDLMSASRMHAKVAKLLTKGGRGSINESQPAFA